MSRLLAPLSGLFSNRSKRQQVNGPLWSPSLWGASTHETGSLEIDGVSIPDLVSRTGSPTMAVSHSRLVADAKRFHKAVSSTFAAGMCAYSYKTNCVPGVLQELHAIGYAAEVISPYELWLAEKLFVPGERIIVNGVNKTKEYIDAAVRLQVASINIDQADELEQIAQAASRYAVQARVSLRLRLDPSSHFGLSISNGEADDVAKRLAERPETFSFQGLHFHLLADDDEPTARIKFQDTALEFARRIGDRYGLKTLSVNVGGGFTSPTMKVMSRSEYALQRFLQIPCRPADLNSGVPIEDYMQQLYAAFQAKCSQLSIFPPKVIFEPGRAITSQSHALLTKVHAIKSNSQGPEIAMTDAGKVLTSYPCDYEYHQMFVANRMNSQADHVYHLMGRLCTSSDWLAKFRCLPKLAPSDVIAIMDAGAYFTSYSSNFAFPRPKIVMLSDGHVRTLRERETYEHLTAMDRDLCDDL